MRRAGRPLAGRMSWGTLLRRTMMIGRPAPDFTAPACMPDNSFTEVSLSSFQGSKHVVLFFYPADFTYVCASELPAFARITKQLAERDAVVLGVSTDTHYAHRAWKLLGPEHGGLSDFDISYPLIGDATKAISHAWDVLLPSGLATRGLFVIDTRGIVQYESRNPPPIGRDVSVPVRILDAIVHLEQAGVTARSSGRDSIAEDDPDEEVIPADWAPGRPTMRPSKDGVRTYLQHMSEDVTSGACG